jgi:hypothetical protein
MHDAANPFNQIETIQNSGGRLGGSDISKRTELADQCTASNAALAELWPCIIQVNSNRLQAVVVARAMVEAVFRINGMRP